MSLKRPPSDEDIIPRKRLARGESDDSDDEEDSPPQVMKEFPNGKFKVRRLTYKTKRTNDDIHTNIDICPVLVAVLDTPQVQRLKKLRQLGVADYVYMTVTHTRFEHSLGVAFLADWMCRQLAQQEQLGITKKDVLCVKIAGLCHDLGHGPFSHVFDGEFVAQVKEVEASLSSRGADNPYAKYPPIPDGWKHEDASLMMIDAMLAYLGMEIDETELDKPLRQIGDGIDAQYFGMSPKAFFGGSYTDDEEPLSVDRVLTSRDWIFIKECIIGGPLEGYSDFVGRGREKEFLYDIVSNRHSGLDVDKIDYFARDQRKANKDAGEIDGHLIRDAFVAWGKCSRPEKCFRCKAQFVEEESDDELALERISQKAQPNTSRSDDEDSKKGMHLMICYPQKLIGNSIDFFHKRFKLHRQIYHHKSSKPVEFMICDILCKSDLHQLIKSEKFPEGLPISRAMVDPGTYLKLRDSIIEVISNSDDPALAEAQALTERLDRRDLYKYATGQEIHGDFEVLWRKSEEEIRSELVGMRTRYEGDVVLSEDDIFVEKCEIHHGAKDLNPVSFMRFLPKRDMPALSKPIDELPEAKEFDENDFLSDTVHKFNKRTIRVYSRSRSQQTVDLLTHTFEQWVDMSVQYGDNAPSCWDEGGEFDERRGPAICSQETPVKERGTRAYAQVSVHNEDQPSPAPVRPRTKRSIFGKKGLGDNGDGSESED